MSKTIIRVRGQEQYPYFVEGEITENETHLKFETVSKKGTKRQVEVLKSEVITKETSEDEE